MATQLTLTLFTLLFTMAVSDDTCPYPCYPPPTGTGTGTGTGTPSTPTVTTPTPPATQYPTPVTYPTPLAGNLPYYPSPPFGNNFYASPPPPDPILPYFPFYYRKPPHGNGVSSAASLSGSIVVIASTNVLAFVLLFGFH